MAIMASVKHINELTTNEKKSVKKIIQYLARLTNWCPVNFRHFYLLLKAEFSRITIKSIDTIELYNQTISLATDQEVLDIIAIANECSARFFTNLLLHDLAQIYIKNAH